LKILIAHQDGLLLSGVRQALEADEGFEIVGEAYDAAAVTPLVGQTAPDIVLLDLQLPGGDGFGSLQRLRSFDPDLKVVMCAMDPDPEQIYGAFHRGACGFILKTINPNDLGAAIRQAAEGVGYCGQRLIAPDESAAPVAPQPVRLTAREREVIQAVARGLSNKAVAAELHVTVQTVKFHLTSIYRKLGITNRTEAARWVMSNGLGSERVGEWSSGGARR